MTTGSSSGRAPHGRRFNHWPPAALAPQIDRLAKLAGGIVGVAAEHLETGATFACNGDLPFPMASTFKIAVAGAILQQIRDGRLTLDQMIEIDNSMRVDSEIIASNLPHAGVALSIHNLLEIMLTLSDNTASDVLVKAAGGASAVTNWLKQSGVFGQRVDRDTAELTRDFFGLGAGPVLEQLRQAVRENPELETKGDFPNPPFDDDPRDTSTPSAMVRLLAMLHGGDALGADRTKILLDMLARCSTGDARLRGLLPPKTVVAHKTGTIGGTVNDAGIVELPNGGHFAIAVFIMKSAKPHAQRERAIAEITRTLYDAYLLAE